MEPIKQSLSQKAIDRRSFLNRVKRVSISSVTAVALAVGLALPNDARA